MAEHLLKFFDSILEEHTPGPIRARPQTRRALRWFRDQIPKLSEQNNNIPTKFEKNTKNSRIFVGQFFLYYYDPKLKKSLPYYDIFPLVLPIKIIKRKGWLGINFHYLNFNARYKLLTKLLPISKPKLKWSNLGNIQKFPEVRPSLHLYLRTHVKSKILRIEEKYWPLAIFLPIGTFKKSTNIRVWRNSQEIIKSLRQTHR